MSARRAACEDGHVLGAERALRYALAHPGRERGVIHVCGTGVADGGGKVSLR
jgi:hypothetical protein